MDALERALIRDKMLWGPKPKEKEKEDQSKKPDIQTKKTK